MNKITNFLERKVAEALNSKGIEFIHETEMPHKNFNLDFFLPKHNVYIEVKQFDTPRTIKQLEANENVILLQGSIAVATFIKLIS